MEELLSFVRIGSIVVWEFEVTLLNLFIKFIKALVFRLCKSSRMGTVEEFRLKSPNLVWCTTGRIAESALASACADSSLTCQAMQN